MPNVSLRPASSMRRPQTGMARYHWTQIFEQLQKRLRYEVCCAACCGFLSFWPSHHTALLVWATAKRSTPQLHRSYFHNDLLMANEIGSDNSSMRWYAQYRVGPSIGGVGIGGFYIVELHFFRSRRVSGKQGQSENQTASLPPKAHLIVQQRY